MNFLDVESTTKCFHLHFMPKYNTLIQVAKEVGNMLPSLIVLSCILGVIFGNQYPQNSYSQPQPVYPGANNDPYMETKNDNHFQPIPTQNAINRGPPPPHYSNQINYRRGFQPPPQEGFFSKIKNSIVGVGNAIAGNFEPQPAADSYSFGRPSNYEQPPPAYQRYPNEYYPPTLPSTRSFNDPRFPQHQSQEPSTGSKLFGKIKSMLTGDEDQHTMELSRDPRQQLPPGTAQNSPPHPSYPLQHSSPPQFPNNVGQQQQQHNVFQYPTLSSTDRQQASPSNGYPEGFARGPGDITEGVAEQAVPPGVQDFPQHQHQQFPAPFPFQSAPPMERISDEPYLPVQRGGPAGYSVPAHTHTVAPATRPAYLDLLDRMSPDPQVFIYEDNIVMIPKPKEFYRKKFVMMAAGSNSLQVFSDFEHVFTKFKLDSSSVVHEKHATERSLGSMELLEISGTMSQEALQRIQMLNQEFDQKFGQLLNEESSDTSVYQLYEDMCVQYQQIVSKYGNVYSGSVLPATRELLGRLGLRTAWKETFQALSAKGIPTFVFSSGFGDVIVNAMLLSGLTEPNAPGSGPAGHFPGSPASAPPQLLPSNLRIISNFFRSAPDGTVRAFSQPVVHEKNKNATTAERLMGMPVPSRPNALVFGSHEDDIHMTDGLSDIQNQLSLGYLELSEDLSQRLPTYLNTFDVVIMGDSSCKFAKSLVEDILQIPRSTSAAATGGKLGITGLGNIRNKLGQLLGEATSGGGNMDKKPFGDYLNNY